MITKTEMVEIISEALYDVADANYDNIDISTLEENGLRTKNKGIVVKLWDGSKFRITVVKSND
jgi:20S proteasome alpha/beta subunit